MLKCEVHLDDEKILADGVYTPEEVHNAVDNAFEMFDLVKGENGFYLEKGNENDFAHFGSVILSLSRTDWFMDYVDKWIWYNSDDSADPENFRTEDVLDFYRSKVGESWSWN